MIKKLPIANRGKIVVRIICTCAKADHFHGHLRKCQQACHTRKKSHRGLHIGPEAITGYLSAQRRVNLVIVAGYNAVHPGYGFLSETPQLPQICRGRKAMLAVRMPVVPGSE